MDMDVKKGLLRKLMEMMGGMDGDRLPSKKTVAIEMSAHGGEEEPDGSAFENLLKRKKGMAC